MPMWFFCDDGTGAIVSGGVATFHDASLQTPPDGQSLYVVPDGSIGFPFSETPDFSLLRNGLLEKVDAEAGTIRRTYITDVPGQAQTYEKKEAEARRWQAGDPDSDYPFMAAEAAAREVPIAQVRAEILAQVDALTPRAALIEAHRLASKERIRNGSTLPAIMAASQIDWEGLLS